jgi:HEPN domain-containing protein
MPHRRFPPTDPREWLNRAKSNLTQAKKTLPGVYLEDLCFNGQQAVEKAIKAVFLHHGLKFPYIHDLAQLLTLLERGGVKVPKYIRKAEELTRFSVEARYPGLSGPISRKEYGKTVRVAEAVLRWAQRQIGQP